MYTCSVYELQIVIIITLMFLLRVKLRKTSPPAHGYFLTVFFCVLMSGLYDETVRVTETETF